MKLHSASGSGIILLILFTTCISCIHCISEDEDPLTLTILHTNDIHSRFLQTSKHSGTCSEKHAEQNMCYGGFSRIHSKVTEIRKTHPNVVYLSAGDYFQGTVWYTLYKWKYLAQFVNQFQHTAMALGNHEFDDGVEGLSPFLNAATFPIISSNINASREPSIQGKFSKSLVVKYEGRNVGIIGYTTTETVDVSKPGKLIFKDELEAVSREAKRLHEDGIQILIALGHAGYDVDMKIATIPYIDVVVGGHTNTFLYTGNAPDIEEPIGEYPTLVVQATGRIVPVVQAYAYGKYLGYLNLTFDSDGEVTHWAGAPILLDSSVPQDPKMEAELQEVSKTVLENARKEVGRTLVFLDGDELSCRMRECNLGNMIADAMVDMYQKFKDEANWNEVSMGIIHGGSIRSSIDELEKNGSVSLEDILTVFPFQNTIDLIEIQGKFLREAFEFSVAGYDARGFHPAGKFLQTSGIRVAYELSQPDGQRVKKLEVLCTKCRVPKYELLNDTKIYKVAAPTFTVTGGDGYKIIQNNLIAYRPSGILDTDVVLQYLQRRSPITQGLEGRITFLENAYNEENCKNSSRNMKSSNIVFYLFVISIVIPILNLCQFN